MKKIVVLLSLLTSVLVFSGFKLEKNLKNIASKSFDFSETRTPGQFNSLSLKGSVDVLYLASDKYQVFVEGKKDNVAKLRTEVKDSNLEIYFEKGLITTFQLKVIVYAPTLNAIALSGSGDFETGSKISVNGTFSAMTAGSGDIDLQSVECADLSINTAGSGDVEINVLTCDNASISSVGSGDIEIDNADIAGSLTASTAGSGEIEINGSAFDVEASTAGSGSISGNLNVLGKIRTSSAGSGKVHWK